MPMLQIYIMMGLSLSRSPGVASPSQLIFYSRSELAASAVIKDISHPLYQTWRDLPDSPRKDRMYQDILDLWSDPDRAHVPPNMDDVGTPKLFN